MATTDPLTGATINDQNDAATGGFQIGRVVTDLRKNVIPRFASAADRDAKFTAAAVAPVAGMVCAVAGALQCYSGSAWVEVGTTAGWTTYTPSWTAQGATTQPSIGNGILTGRYRRLDAYTGAVRILLQIGTTTVGGNGTAYSFGLPAGWTNRDLPAILPGWYQTAGDEGSLTAFVAKDLTGMYPLRADNNNALIGNGLLTAAGNFITVGGIVQLDPA